MQFEESSQAHHHEITACVQLASGAKSPPTQIDLTDYSLAWQEKEKEEEEICRKGGSFSAPLRPIRVCLAEASQPGSRRRENG